MQSRFYLRNSDKCIMMNSPQPVPATSSPERSEPLKAAPLPSWTSIETLHSGNFVALLSLKTTSIHFARSRRRAGLEGNGQSDESISHFAGAGNILVSLAENHHRCKGCCSWSIVVEYSTFLIPLAFHNLRATED